MPFGGEQALAIHKLPGGAGVIDTLGPDDRDISWHGRFWGDNAYATALTLDAMRRAGQVLSLSFAGQAYSVVIQEFTAEIERLPQDVLYHISCVTVTNAQGTVSGVLGGGPCGGDGDCGGVISAQRRAKRFKAPLRPGT